MIVDAFTAGVRLVAFLAGVAAAVGVLAGLGWCVRQLVLGVRHSRLGWRWRAWRAVRRSSADVTPWRHDSRDARTADRARTRPHRGSAP